MAKAFWRTEQIAADSLADFFCANVDPSYISHSELMYGLAETPDRWSEDLRQLVIEDQAERTLGAPRAGNGDSLGHTICAFEGADLAGLLNCRFETGARRPYAVLEDVVVDRDRRGGGVFTSMYALFRDAAADLGIGRLFLESGRTNHSAHEIFRALGFREVSEVFMAEL